MSDQKIRPLNDYLLGAGSYNAVEMCTADPIVAHPMDVYLACALYSGAPLGDWHTISDLYRAKGVVIPVGARVIGSNGKVYQVASGSDGLTDPALGGTGWTEPSTGGSSATGTTPTSFSGDTQPDPAKVKVGDVWITGAAAVAPYPPNTALYWAGSKWRSYARDWADARHTGMATMTAGVIPAGAGNTLVGPKTYKPWAVTQDDMNNFDEANGNLIIPDWADYAIVNIYMLIHSTANMNANPVVYLGINGDHTHPWAVGASGPLAMSGVGGLDVNGFYWNLGATLLLADKQSVFGASQVAVTPLVSGGGNGSYVIDSISMSWEFKRYGENVNGGGGNL